MAADKILNPPKIKVLPPSSESETPPTSAASNKSLPPSQSKEKEGEEQQKDENAGETGLVRGHFSLACDVCGAMIRYKAYNDHIKSHKPPGSIGSSTGMIRNSSNAS